MLDATPQSSANDDAAEGPADGSSKFEINDIVVDLEYFRPAHDIDPTNEVEQSLGWFHTWHKFSRWTGDLKVEPVHLSGEDLFTVDLNMESETFCTKNCLRVPDTNISLEVTLRNSQNVLFFDITRLVSPELGDNHYLSYLCRVDILRLGYLVFSKAFVDVCISGNSENFVHLAEIANKDKLFPCTARFTIHLLEADIHVLHKWWGFPPLTNSS